MVLLGVVLVTFLVFIRAFGFDYINFDDHDYTYRNPHIIKGFSWEGMIYAFSGTRELGIWFPLTVLSYMLDVFVGGVVPETFHLSSILWHCVATAALFLLLTTIWRWKREEEVSLPQLLCIGALTLLWSVHPQRLESVVWIAGRKDILSGLFTFLTLYYYLLSLPATFTGNAPRHPALSRTMAYGMALLCYCGAVMSKPIAMTVPLGMICLEWLLREKISWKELIIPMIMAGLCGLTAVQMQSDGHGDIARLMPVSLSDRIVASLASISYYLRATLLPSGTTIFHPWPLNPEYGKAVMGLLITGCATGLFLVAFFKAKGKGLWSYAVLPIWYIGAMFPMLSLFVFGSHSCADRFTYYPAIIFVVGLCLYFCKFDTRKVFLPLSSLALIFAVLTMCEMSHWKNTRTVFSRAVAVYPVNPMAYCLLGKEYMRQGPEYYEKAVELFNRSIEQMPNSENIGVLAFLLATQGTKPPAKQRAAELARWVIEKEPQDYTACVVFGILKLQEAQWAEATEWLERSIKHQRIKQPFVYEWLGMAKFNQKEYNGALKAFETALTIEPTPALFQKCQAAQEKLNQPQGPLKQ